MKIVNRLLPFLILIAILTGGCASPTQPPAEEPAVEEPAAEEPAAEEPVALTVWYWGEQEARVCNRLWKRLLKNTWNRTPT